MTEFLSMQRAFPHVIMHHACLVRGVVGSVGHQQGKCSCFGVVDVSEPDSMTAREAAKAAAEHFKQCRKVEADPYGWRT